MPKAKKIKLVVFVPTSHLEKVRQAICGAGAGRLGNYDNCTFISQGIGTFRPLPGAKPHLGQVGILTRVKEARVETIVFKKDLRAVVKALKQAHPYEEIAYDVIPLLDN